MHPNHLDDRGESIYARSQNNTVHLLYCELQELPLSQVGIEPTTLALVLMGGVEPPKNTQVVAILRQLAALPICVHQHINSDPGTSLREAVVNSAAPQY